MATINFGRREILCKIVYYGPGLSGKTTNLQTVHNKVPDNLRGKLTSVATRQDRTLFFDLLPVELGKIRDFTIRLQLYTVPGQVYYNASRKIVLKGVDGVVFVADSQRDKMDENIESLNNLRDNLTDNGVDPATIPVIMQYNKRDLSPIYSIEELNEALNSQNLSYFESIATTGHGVFNTLKAISSLVIGDIKSKLDRADRKAVVQPAPTAQAEPTQVETVADQPVPAAPTPPPPSITTPPPIAPSPSEPVPTVVPEDAASPAQPPPPPPTLQPLTTSAEQPLSEAEFKPAEEARPEEVEEPDRAGQKQGFWDKVSTLFKRTRK